MNTAQTLLYTDFQFIAVHEEHGLDIVHKQYTDFQFIAGHEVNRHNEHNSDIVSNSVTVTSWHVGTTFVS